MILAVAITVVATPWWNRVAKNTFVAYFANANGLYTGDEVRILGVEVGTVEAIDPQPNRTKVTFSVDSEYPVPADARAAILSPSLVSARAIQLVPRTPADRNWLRARPFRRSAPRCPSSGTTSVSSWRSSPTPCSPPRPADRAR